MLELFKHTTANDRLPEFFGEAIKLRRIGRKTTYRKIPMAKTLTRKGNSVNIFSAENRLTAVSPAASGQETGGCTFFH